MACKSVRLISPFAPGGGTDITAGALASNSYIKAETQKWAKVGKSANIKAD